MKNSPGFARLFESETLMLLALYGQQLRAVTQHASLLASYDLNSALHKFATVPSEALTCMSVREYYISIDT